MPFVIYTRFHDGIKNMGTTIHVVDIIKEWMEVKNHLKGAPPNAFIISGLRKWNRWTNS